MNRRGWFHTLLINIASSVRLPERVLACRHQARRRFSIGSGRCDCASASASLRQSTCIAIASVWIVAASVAAMPTESHRVPRLIDAQRFDAAGHRIQADQQFDDAYVAVMGIVHGTGATMSAPRRRDEMLRAAVGDDAILIQHIRNGHRLDVDRLSAVDWAILALLSPHVSPLTDYHAVMDEFLHPDTRAPLLEDAAPILDRAPRSVQLGILAGLTVARPRGGADDAESLRSLAVALTRQWHIVNHINDLRRHQATAEGLLELLELASTVLRPAVQPMAHRGHRDVGLANLAKDELIALFVDWVHHPGRAADVDVDVDVVLEQWRKLSGASTLALDVEARSRLLAWVPHYLASRNLLDEHDIIADTAELGVQAVGSRYAIRRALLQLRGFERMEGHGAGTGRESPRDDWDDWRPHVNAAADALAEWQQLEGWRDHPWQTRLAHSLLPFFSAKDDHGSPAPREGQPGATRRDHLWVLILLAEARALADWDVVRVGNGWIFENEPHARDMLETGLVARLAHRNQLEVFSEFVDAASDEIRGSYSLLASIGTVRHEDYYAVDAAEVLDPITMDHLRVIERATRAPRHSDPRMFWEEEAALVVRALIYAKHQEQKGLDAHYSAGFIFSEQELTPSRREQLRQARVHLLRAQAIYRGFVRPEYWNFVEQRMLQDDGEQRRVEVLASFMRPMPLLYLRTGAHPSYLSEVVADGLLRTWAQIGRLDAGLDAVGSPDTAPWIWGLGDVTKFADDIRQFMKSWQQNIAVELDEARLREREEGARFGVAVSDARLRAQAARLAAAKVRLKQGESRAKAIDLERGAAAFEVKAWGLEGEGGLATLGQLQHHYNAAFIDRQLAEQDVHASQFTVLALGSVLPQLTADAHISQARLAALKGQLPQSGEPQRATRQHEVLLAALHGGIHLEQPQGDLASLLSGLPWLQEQLELRAVRHRSGGDKDVFGIITGAVTVVAAAVSTYFTGSPQIGLVIGQGMQTARAAYKGDWQEFVRLSVDIVQDPALQQRLGETAIGTKLQGTIGKLGYRLPGWAASPEFKGLLKAELARLPIPDVIGQELGLPARADLDDRRAQLAAAGLAVLHSADLERLRVGGIIEDVQNAKSELSQFGIDLDGIDHDKLGRDIQQRVLDAARMVYQSDLLSDGHRRQLSEALGRAEQGPDAIQHNVAELRQRFREAAEEAREIAEIEQQIDFILSLEDRLARAAHEQQEGLRMRVNDARQQLGIRYRETLERLTDESGIDGAVRTLGQMVGSVPGAHDREHPILRVSELRTQQDEKVAELLREHYAEVRRHAAAVLHDDGDYQPDQLAHAAEIIQVVLAELVGLAAQQEAEAAAVAHIPLREIAATYHAAVRHAVASSVQEYFSLPRLPELAFDLDSQPVEGRAQGSDKDWLPATEQHIRAVLAESWKVVSDTVGHAELSARDLDLLVNTPPATLNPDLRIKLEGLQRDVDFAFRQLKSLASSEEVVEAASAINRARDYEQQREEIRRLFEEQLGKQLLDPLEERLSNAINTIGMPFPGALEDGAVNREAANWIRVMQARAHVSFLERRRSELNREAADLAEEVALDLNIDVPQRPDDSKGLESWIEDVDTAVRDALNAAVPEGPQDARGIARRKPEYGNLLQEREEVRRDLEKEVVFFRLSSGSEIVRSNIEIDRFEGGWRRLLMSALTEFSVRTLDDFDNRMDQSRQERIDAINWPALAPEGVDVGETVDFEVIRQVAQRLENATGLWEDLRFELGQAWRMDAAHRKAHQKLHAAGAGVRAQAFLQGATAARHQASKLRLRAAEYQVEIAHLGVEVYQNELAAEAALLEAAQYEYQRTQVNRRLAAIDRREFELTQAIDSPRRRLMANRQLWKAARDGAWLSRLFVGRAAEPALPSGRLWTPVEVEDYLRELGDPVNDRIRMRQGIVARATTYWSVELTSEDFNERSVAAVRAENPVRAVTVRFELETEGDMEDWRSHVQHAWLRLLRDAPRHRLDGALHIRMRGDSTDEWPQDLPLKRVPRRRPDGAAHLVSGIDARLLLPPVREHRDPMSVYVDHTGVVMLWTETHASSIPMKINWTIQTHPIKELRLPVTGANWRQELGMNEAQMRHTSAGYPAFGEYRVALHVDDIAWLNRHAGDAWKVQLIIAIAARSE